LTFIDGIFESYDPRGNSRVPMTKYQEYCIRRFKVDSEFDTSQDLGRFQALQWYIEAYSTLRRPLRVPFSAEQVRWMLTPDAPYVDARALPRIVEAFTRRFMDTVNPYRDDDRFLTIAYWWSIEYAVACGVEHFLVPDIFIAALSVPKPSGPVIFPINPFLSIYIERHPSDVWLTHTPIQRLACYIRALSAPGGIHHGLFFPPTVLKTLTNLADPALTEDGLLGIGPADVDRVTRLALAAADYAARHKRLRSGRQNISAVILDRDWEKVSKKPAKRPQNYADLPVMDGAGSTFPAPVRVIGAIASQSGLGQATRMSIESLRRAGVQPQVLDFYLDNPAPRTMFYREPAITPAAGAINIMHLNGESLPLASAYLKPEMFEGAYNIGYFFWELPQAARCHHLALELLDEIWVSSDFNLKTYSALTDKPVIKVGMAVEDLPVSSDGRNATRAAYALPLDATVFMTTFDTYSFISRKNPAAAIRAFLTAFGQTAANVRLIIKTHNMTAVLGESNARRLVTEIQDLVAADERIILIDQTLPYADLLVLKAACDCYVSLHRSEGWGFGALEAMQLGLPVIATAFSGNLEFCTPETAYNVPYKPVYLKPNDYIFVQPGDFWAEPDEAAAAAMMQAVAGDPAAAKVKGVAGKAFVGMHFSQKAVGKLYRTRLTDISRMTSIEFVSS
jgi:glycosyltransferase involved in cell wall biosynthesis